MINVGVWRGKLVGGDYWNDITADLVRPGQIIPTA
jgi:hypothetical protein